MKNFNVEIVAKGNIKNCTAVQGEVLMDVFVKNSIRFDFQCAGNGKCGKCRVVCQGALSPIDEEEIRMLGGDEKNGVRLACRARVEGDVHVLLDETKFTFQNEEYIVPKGFMCIDLGTTNVWTAYNDGEKTKTVSFANPQGMFGADVISRISAYQNGYGEQMRDLIKNAVNSIAPNGAYKKIIFGNTAMQMLYNGYDVSPLGHHPYQADEKFGRFINGEYFAPCVSGFVGGDVAGGLYYAVEKGIIKEKTALYADIGTNGEMVLIHNGQMLSCATAAGPCFEGAGISCGVRWSNGAIIGASVDNGAIKCRVLDSEKPTGICGTGLIGIVSALLRLGVISQTGLLECDKYDLGGVYITRQDVRALQNAKAAIRAGIRILCQTAGITENDIEKIYLAGAFGDGLNVSDTVRIGMLPNVPCETLGNCTLKGACYLAGDVMRADEMEKFAQKIEYIELSDSDEFTDEYIEAMGF